MKTQLGYTWFESITKNNEGVLKNQLMLDPPFLFSVVFSRQCNLSCKHCLFLDDNYEVKDKNLFGNEILKFASHMPLNSFLIHEGRILERRHIDILVEVKKQRPDIKIGMIDNGSYVKYYADLLLAKQKGFIFDWIDISLDGSAIAHNIQRNNNKAFENAIIGIEQAKEISKVVNILTCVTTINANDILNLYSYLKNSTLLLPLISEWHLIDYSLTRRKGGDGLQLHDREYEKFWSQVKEIAADKEIGEKIKMRFYSAHNLKYLLNAIGYEESRDAIRTTKDFQHSSMSFLIEGIEVYYFPQSISVGEVLVIDTNLHYYLPYSIKYRSKELFDMILGSKEIQSRYLVGDITNHSREKLYEKGSAKFIDNFFEKYFIQERELLQTMF